MNNELIKSKTIKVSAQRHLVIPKEYYDMLGIGECISQAKFEPFIN